MNVTWLLHLYPRAWRRRYEAEMAALLAQHQVTWSTGIDLVRGALDAHLHPHGTACRSQRTLQPVGSGGHPMESQRFAQYTARARAVLVHGQEEAQRMRHAYLGTEHQLLGLLREEEGIAAHVLRSLGVDLEDVRAAVLAIVGYGTTTEAGTVRITPRAKRVMAYAEEEARQMHHHYIGTEHLLLGLLREKEGLGVGILVQAGLNVRRIRSEVMRRIQDIQPE